MWWTLIWWRWKETAPMYPWRLAHTRYYGLLPSRGQHSTGQLVNCSVQVSICLFILQETSTITMWTHWSWLPVPQQHVLWSQVHFQPGMEVPEISADHDVPRPPHPAAASHHLQPPLHPLQQVVSTVRQEETRGRAGREGPRAQLITSTDTKQWHNWTKVPFHLLNDICDSLKPLNTGPIVFKFSLIMENKTWKFNFTLYVNWNTLTQFFSTRA